MNKWITNPDLDKNLDEKLQHWFDMMNKYHITNDSAEHDRHLSSGRCFSFEEDIQIRWLEEIYDIHMEHHWVRYLAAGTRITILDKDKYLEKSQRVLQFQILGWSLKMFGDKYITYDDTVLMYRPLKENKEV